MHARHVITAAAFALAACTASAQQLQPGLWEIGSTLTSSNGEVQQAMAQAQAQMANLPPEQRKMIQDMMAKQGVGMTPGGGNSVRICLTREMVERDQLPAQQGDCKTTSTPRSGNSMKMSFSCTRPVSSGEGSVTFLSPREYQSRMKVRTTQNGRTDTTDIQSTGKWLSADCGAIRPVTAAPAK